MKVTIAICTWNRAQLLDQTLTEMHKLRIPSGVEWELLVVNNNCTDDTDDVIARHADALPIRRLFERKPGHSNARNCAVAAAQGELIIWTDDDVLVAPDWVESYASAAERWPEVAYFGGVITPWYETPPPPWITANLRLFQGAMLIRNFGREERLLEETEDVFGANMAFRRHVFDRWTFDPELGRRGNESVLGDETALIARMREHSLQGVWVPGAAVRHYVPATRVTRRYIWDYCHGLGRTRVRLKGAPAGRVLLGAPRWLYRRRWSLWAKAHLQRLLGRNTWVATYTQAARVAGTICESRMQRGKQNEHKTLGQ